MCRRSPLSLSAGGILLTWSEREDLLLLDAIQGELPLVPDPWTAIGKDIGLSGEDVLSRLQELADAGILRGISPILESRRRSGGISTLVALKVPEEDLRAVVAQVNRYPEVSHNFLREHPYNLWFTLAAATPDRVEEIISEILQVSAIPPEDLLNLVTIRRYKIDVTFPFIRQGSE